MLKRFWFLFLLAVPGCTNAPSATEAGLLPVTYRTIIAETVRKTFTDPRSLQDAALGDPERGRFRLDSGWWVCLRVDARNVYSGYVALQTTGYFFRNGKLADIVPDEPSCARADFHPWSPWDIGPSLEHGRHLGVNFDMSRSEPVVASVDAGSIGAMAGLMSGDTLTAYAGQPLRNRYDVAQAVGDAPAGGATIDIVRDGEPVTVQVSFP